MDYKLDISKVVMANINDVYDACTNLEKLKKWFCPEGMSIPEMSLDLNIGGRYKVTMQDKDGKNHTAKGEFKEIEKNKKLVMTWKWDGSEMGDEKTLLTIELELVSDNETKIILTHEHFASKESSNEHKKGWMSVLNNLANYLEK